MSDSKYFNTLFENAKPIHFVETWISMEGCLDHACYLPTPDDEIRSFIDSLGRKAILIPMDNTNVIIHEFANAFRWTMAIGPVRKFRVHALEVGKLSPEGVEGLFQQLETWRWVFKNQA